jgi:hypothetical protein
MIVKSNDYLKSGQPGQDEITVEESQAEVKGMRIDKGYSSPTW